MEPDEIAQLIAANETERLELKSSLDATSDREDIREAACSFANDYPRSQQPGLVVVGVRPDLSPSGVAITPELTNHLEEVLDDHRMAPRLVGRVYRSLYGSSTVAVLEVEPSAFPPVTYKGQVCIRHGQRRGYASEAQQARLRERVPASNLPFDMRPCTGSSLSEIPWDLIESEYLPMVVDRDRIQEDRRPVSEKLASLRLCEAASEIPTNGAIAMFSELPTRYLPGSTVQYVHYAGTDRSCEVLGSRSFSGSIISQLRSLELFLKGPSTEERVEGGEPGPAFPENYPPAAMRELVVNAVSHRAYDGTAAPTMITQYADRVEIQNPGGLFGQVSRTNFGHTNDYRNPLITGILKSFGFVEKYGSGIPRVKRILRERGNPPPIFQLDDPLSFQVTVRRPA